MSEQLNFLWALIKNYHEFEIISYLTVSREDDESDWFLTPQTRDGQRDGEGHSIGGVNFFEAKFFEQDNGKLNLTRIGTNILIAVYNNANKIYIFTNGHLAPNIVKFLEKHNYIESGDHTRTEIIFYDRLQTAIAILKHTPKGLIVANDEMKFINYRSLSEDKLENYKKANQRVVTKILRSLSTLKSENEHNFFLNPTISNFINIPDQHIEIALQNYLSIQICYNDNITNSESTHISVGVPFIFYLTLTNYLLNTIYCEIGIRTINNKNKFQVLNGWLKSKNEDLIEEIIVSPLKNEIIPINGLFYDDFYEGLDITVDVYSDQHQFLLRKTKEIRNEIHVTNKFFFSHYYGEENKLKKQDIIDIIDKSYNEKTYNIRLIKGAAGVGKSRFIDEILNETNNLVPKRDVLKCTIGQDNFISILLKILYLTTGLDYNSFIEIQKQVKNECSIEKSQLNSLFSNENELESFCDQINRLNSLKAVELKDDDIRVYAITVCKMILKFHRSISILVFEDMHRASLQDFQFILEINDYLTKYSRGKSILILLATRIHHSEIIVPKENVIEKESYGLYYDYFEANLKNRFNNNIITVLNNLNGYESRAMILDLFHPYDENIYHIDRIISLCGNNPFCIIHTLIQLRNLNIVSRHGSLKLYLEEVNRLETVYNPHEQVDHIFNNRFNYYRQHKSHDMIFQIIYILVIFKSGVEFDILKKIINYDDEFHKALKLLDEERIVIHKEGVIKFEHENLFIYASNKLMSNGGEIADKVFEFLCSAAYDNQFTCEYKVRALFWGTSKYKNDFFFQSKEYFNSLLELDLWKESIFYGELILKKNEVSLTPLDKIEVELKIIMLQNESDEIDIALQRMTTLYDKVTIEICKNKNLDERYYDLYLEICLQKADVELHAAQTIRSKDSFKRLLYEIDNKRDAISLNRQKELKSWIYNRLAVIDMKNRKYNEGKEKLIKGLNYANEINHVYYIHHCYYDLCIISLLVGAHDDMLKFCNKSKLDILNATKYRNASLRTIIQEGLVLFLEKRINEAKLSLEVAIETASFNNYFHEANRGLLYLASIYLYQNETEKADQILIKGIKFTEIDKAKKLQLGIYSGYIFRCHQKYLCHEKMYLQEAQQYYKKAVNLIFNKQGLNITVNYWIALVISNLKTFDSFLVELQPTYTNSLYCDPEFMVVAKHLRNYQLELDENSIRFKLNINEAAEKSLSPYYAIFS